MKIDMPKDGAYFFFSRQRYGKPIEEQEATCSRLNIPVQRRIGAGHALLQSCVDIREAAAILSRGDMLVVQDRRALGSEWKEILKTMTWFHEKGIGLAICDLGYCDSIRFKDGKPYSVGNDYELTRNLISSMDKPGSKKRKRKTDKPVRPGARGPEPIRIQDFPDRIQAAFRNYCTNRKFTMKDVQAVFVRESYKMPSPTVFMRLVQDMDGILLEEHKGDKSFKVFRSVRFRTNHDLPWRGDQVEDQY